MPMNPNDFPGPAGYGTVGADPPLRDRFTRLWRRCLVAGVKSDPKAVWHALAAHYAEPHRRYHNQRHLAHCLEQLDLASGLVERPEEVEMAIWFHDVVNEPGRPDNEALSAALFHDLAGDVMAEGFVSAVSDLILVTTHEYSPTDLDRQFICDIDFSSFGCPWDCYLRDTTALQAEFPGPDEDYFRGKSAFLQGLLRRPKIFMTDFFNDRYERRARENIRRLLDLIEQQRG